MSILGDILSEASQASQQALTLGLTHMGYGRFGRNGKATHVSKMGRLIPIEKAGNVQTLAGGQLKHLEHSDDEVFNNGSAGVRNVVDHIHAIRHNDERVKLGVKVDGSPSVVMGTHPDTGKFFVASKSAFNKDPKINYTPEDIERNHGHAPGLVAKLKTALEHGPKLGIKGVVQGDMLYGEDDVKSENNKLSFKPNTIKYSIDKNHPEGKKIAKSKMGIAIHTEYKDGQAVLNPDIKVKSHPDVYNMPVQLDTSKIKFDHEKLKHHTSEIGKLTKAIPKEGWDAVTHPDLLEHVKTYINQKVRKNETDYNVPELVKHITDRSQKDIDKVKTAKAKVEKIEKRNSALNHVHANAHHFENAFRIQEHINHAKHHIIDQLNKNATFDHEYEDGEKTHPEGYVAVGHHGPLKFVNRSDFSRANFAMSANRK